MVSVASYTLAEYILAVVASYVLVGLAAFVVAASRQMEGELKFAGWRGGLAIFAGGALLLAGLYALPVRIGTVMFVNGMLFIVILWCVWEWVRWLREAE